MLVNVTDVFTSEGKVLTQEFAWETAEITHDGSSYPVKSSSKLLLKLTNTAKHLWKRSCSLWQEFPVTDA